MSPRRQPHPTCTCLAEVTHELCTRTALGQPSLNPAPADLPARTRQARAAVPRRAWIMSLIWPG
jgi:hypothetical protein